MSKTARATRATGNRGGARRFITRIELTKPTQMTLHDVTESAGMTQVAVLSRLVCWFADQDETMRAMILGNVPPELRSSVAEMYMAKLTQTGAASKPSE